MTKPQDPRPPEQVCPRELLQKFLQICAQHPRVAICGPPRCGKSTLSRAVRDRRVFTAQEFEDGDWDSVPERMLDATRDEPRFVIEGVMGARYLRRAAKQHDPCPVDAVVWLGCAVVEQSKGQRAMGKGIRTVFEEWRRRAGGVPVYVLSEETTTRGDQRRVRRARRAR